jgi:hypothetical protein
MTFMTTKLIESKKQLHLVILRAFLFNVFNEKVGFCLYFGHPVFMLGVMLVMYKND